MHHWLTCPATYGQMAPGQKSKRRRISFCGVSKIPAIGGGDKCNQCEGKEETDPSKSSLVKCVTPVTPRSLRPLLYERRKKRQQLALPPLLLLRTSHANSRERRQLLIQFLPQMDRNGAQHLSQIATGKNKK